MTSSKIVRSMQRRYGLYINARRALPSFGDGLKDAARKALHVMRSKSRTKTQALAGAMVDQRLYVHGDASQPICTIAAPFSNNLPLLTGLGNFGTKLYPKAYSAPRYTEVEKPSYVDLVYKDYDIVPMEPNYDETNESPLTLLPPIPLLLVNGSSGMGYGWSSTILPRDPKQICQAVADILAGKKPKRLVPWFGWADCNVEFVDYSAKGGMTWRFSGHVEINDTSTVTITELPPETSLDELIECLMEMEEAGIINGFEDYSAKEIKVTVKLKRGTAKDWTEKDAIEYLKKPGSKVPFLVATRTENFVTTSVDGGSVKQYKYDNGELYPDPLERYLRDWIEWRFGWYKERFAYLLKKSSREHRLMLCLLACHDSGLPKRLAKIKSREHLRKDIEDICKPICFDSEELKEIVGYISSLPTYKWIVEERDSAAEREKELSKMVADYQDLVGNEARRRGVFASETAATMVGVERAMKEIADFRAKSTGKKKK